MGGFKVLFSLLLTAALLQSLATSAAAHPMKLQPEEHTVDGNAEDDGNYWEKSGYFEGDIVLDESHFRNGRISQITGKPARFPNTSIPYVIDPGFDAEQNAAIQKAFAEYHAKSCIRFRPATPQDVDHVYIQVNEKGCNSQVGLIGGRQYIRLQKSKPGTGCFKHGTLVHELLHSLGFFHQHSSTNRDRYVKIAWENIKPEAKHNFNKYSRAILTTFGVDYDYGSIMHYSSKAFSANGKETIVPKQPGVTIGQRTALSSKDIQKLNAMYECRAPGGYSDDAETYLEQWLTDSELLV